MSESAAESAECATNPLRGLLVSRPVPGRTIARVIGFSGLAQHGKTTAALHAITAGGATRLRFADTLKRMLLAFGCSQEQVDGREKESPSALLCGQTPRHAMQTLGMWGRREIGEKVWVNTWLKQLEAIEPYRLVVADDVRFPNEVDAVHSVGGFIVHIVRPNHKSDVPAHETEAHAEFLPFDRRIINDATPETFRGNLISILADLNVAWSKAA